jgi:hypothetical protein
MPPLTLRHILRFFIHHQNFQICVRLHGKQLQPLDLLVPCAVYTVNHFTDPTINPLVKPTIERRYPLNQIHNGHTRHRQYHEKSVNYYSWQCQPMTRLLRNLLKYLFSYRFQFQFPYYLTVLSTNPHVSQIKFIDVIFIFFPHCGHFFGIRHKTTATKIINANVIELITINGTITAIEIGRFIYGSSIKKV